MKEKSKFEYEIVSHLALLNETSDTFKEVNLVSYNGAEPKLDIRVWRRIGSEEKMLKGIALTNDEALILMEALQKFFEGKKKSERSD